MRASAILLFFAGANAALLARQTVDQSCATTCGEQAATSHLTEATACAKDVGDQNAAAACVCASDVLRGAVADCMQSQCPDSASLFLQGCQIINGQTGTPEPDAPATSTGEVPTPSTTPNSGNALRVPGVAFLTLVLAGAALL